MYNTRDMVLIFPMLNWSIVQFTGTVYDEASQSSPLINLPRVITWAPVLHRTDSWRECTDRSVGGPSDFPAGPVPDTPNLCRDKGEVQTNTQSSVSETSKFTILMQYFKLFSFEFVQGNIKFYNNVAPIFL